MAFEALNFDSLVDTHIERTTSRFARRKPAEAATSAVTLRNWMIGYYIAEFEQSETDRAQTVPDSWSGLRSAGAKRHGRCRRAIA